MIGVPSLSILTFLFFASCDSWEPTILWIEFDKLKSLNTMTGKMTTLHVDARIYDYVLHRDTLVVALLHNASEKSNRLYYCPYESDDLSKSKLLPISGTEDVRDISLSPYNGSILIRSIEQGQYTYSLMRSIASGLVRLDKLAGLEFVHWLPNEKALFKRNGVHFSIDLTNGQEQVQPLFQKMMGDIQSIHRTSHSTTFVCRDYGSLRLYVAADSLIRNVFNTDNILAMTVSEEVDVPTTILIRTDAQKCVLYRYNPASGMDSLDLSDKFHNHDDLLSMTLSRNSVDQKSVFYLWDVKNGGVFFLVDTDLKTIYELERVPFMSREIKKLTIASKNCVSFPKFRTG